MVCSIGILIFSTALFIFYLQTVCEKALRREFSRAYFQDILNAIDLEFPRLRQAMLNSAEVSYPQIRLALKSDFFTLTYLLKKGNPEKGRFSWQERLLIGYFRVLLLILPIRYAFHFHERQAVVKLTSVLHCFANLVGERVAPVSTPGIATSQQG